MPTENRSSNTEMVSVPPYIGLEPLVGRYYPAQCRRCGWVGSSEELTEDDAQCTRDIGDRLCLGDCDELERHDLLNIIQAMAAPQPHPEPIAWMVGTAFWWTKEEAERDEAETGKTITPIGPMSGIAPADEHQGEPVAHMARVKLGSQAGQLIQVEHATNLNPQMYDGPFPVFRHADPGEVDRLVAANTEYARRHLELNAEVERLREGSSKPWKVVCDQRAELDTLRAQLAEKDSFIHELEANTDPAGTVRDNTLFRDQLKQCNAMIGRLKSELAERDALLHRWVGKFGHLGGCATPLRDETKAALSASAEPSSTAWSCGPCKVEMADKRPCDLCGAEPIAPYSATHYYPAAAPDRKWRKQVGGLWCEFCGGKWLPLDEQGMSHEYVAIEPSAPVERDERAAFEAYMDEIVRVNNVNGIEYPISRRCDLCATTRAVMFEGWQARAALERKPS